MSRRSRSRRASPSLAGAAAVLLLAACGGGEPADPATARCDEPRASFAAPLTGHGRAEVGARFTCEGATLEGTLTLPRGGAPHPAVVWVAGSGEGPRLTYRGAPLVRALVAAGFAVLAYDKRGQGESQGECCPGDDGHFNLLAADVAGAVNALRTRRDIDPDRIGVIGVSQAGWIVPLAARFGHVAFTALVDAPTVSHGTERLYSRLTGEEGDGDGDLSKAEIAERLRSEGPSGFDPAPFIARMPGPGLWLYGAEDQSQPTAASVAVLERVRRPRGRDFTVEVYPRAGHGLLDLPPSDARAMPRMIAWLREQARARRDRG